MENFRVPIDPKVKAQLQSIGKMIGAQLPPGWGFGLFLFTFGEKGSMTWISNAQRSDMIAALQEFIRMESET